VVVAQGKSCNVVFGGLLYYIGIRSVYLKIIFFAFRNTQQLHNYSKLMQSKKMQQKTKHNIDY